MQHLLREPGLQHTGMQVGGGVARHRSAAVPVEHGHRDAAGATGAGALGGGVEVDDGDIWRARGQGWGGEEGASVSAAAAVGSRQAKRAGGGRAARSPSIASLLPLSSLYAAVMGARH